MSNAQFSAKYDSRIVSELVDRVHTVWIAPPECTTFRVELRDFAQKWDRGKFDKGQLDGAISAIQHALDHNKMPPNARDAISDDVSQLRKTKPTIITRSATRDSER